MQHQTMVKRCRGGWTEKATWDSLPAEVIHRIQLFLPADEAYRPCMLSRASLQAWSTTPYLVFREPFEKRIVRNMEQRRKDWIKFIDNTILRYDVNRLSIERLHLCIRIETVDLVSLVNRWLQISAQRGIKHLRLESYYARLGLSLEVHQPDFGFGSGRWRSLQILELRYVNIQEEEINNLSINDNCPFLERIMLKFCKGFKKIKVVKLDHLREFEIRILEETVVEIEDAPSLCTLSFEKSGRHTNLYFRIAEASCKNLKHLILKGTNMDQRFLGRLISRLTSLERLNLGWCHSLPIINITSDTLKDLTLNSCSIVREINIHAPKLNLFCYGGSALPALSFGSLVPVKEETGIAERALHEPFTWKYFF